MYCTAPLSPHKGCLRSVCDDDDDDDDDDELTRLDVHSSPNLVASFPLSLAMTERPFLFCDSPFSFSVSMLFYFLIVL